MDGREFLEEAMAGVEGFRRDELFAQYGKAGGTDEKELAAVIEERFGKSRREADGWYVYWPRWSRMEVPDALRRLIGYPEWGEFFVMCCESGIHRLRAQACQFHAELEHRGVKTEVSQVEDELMLLAGELLPDTDAGSLDPKGVLLDEARRWLYGRVGDTPTAWEAFEGADRDLPLSEFRAELRRRLRAATERSAA